MSSHNELHEQKEALMASEKFHEAIRVIEEIIALEGINDDLAVSLGRTQLRAGNPKEALTALADIGPSSDKYLDAMLVTGHAHKALNKPEDAAKAYRALVDGDSPHLQAVGFWSLVDLKTRKLSDDEIEKLKAFVKQHESSPDVRYLADYSMIKVAESEGDYQSAFEFAQKANNIAAQLKAFDPAAFQNFVQDGMTTNWKRCQSHVSEAPIFIVGMHRSGSTLLEQILASHSRIEATDELPYIRRQAVGLEREGMIRGFAGKSADDLSDMARDYLAKMKSHQPDFNGFLIDKEPTNFLHIGLIFALFPNAKIINIVRDPLDNAMAVYKQFFAKGNEYSNSLEGIVFYWQGYMTLMNHWLKQYGDRILNVSYANLASSPDAEITRVFEYLNIPLEEATLKFYEQDRPVLTPSAAQVRQPINTKSLRSSESYEPFLGEFMPKFEQMRSFIPRIFRFD
jgi:tetratricopeptide (TPR) repeat protein